MFDPIPFDSNVAILCDPFTWLAVGTALASVVGGVINAFTTKSSNDKNSSFAKEQFEYEKELNNNKYQMNVADMQKAGLNPLNLNNASVSHSYHSANQQAFDSSPTISALSNIATSYMSNKNQKSIADDNNDTALQVARINANVQNTKNQQEHELAVEQFKSEKAREDYRLINDVDNQNAINAINEVNSIRSFLELKRDIIDGSILYKGFKGFERFVKDLGFNSTQEFEKLNHLEQYNAFIKAKNKGRLHFTPYKSKYEN